jgi:transposase-like protein
MEAGESVQSAQPAQATAPKAPTLDERRQLALRLLVLGKSVARVAKELELSRQTIYRWREDPAFEAELKRLRDQAWGEVVARLKGLLEPSLNVLEAELRHDLASQRYRAATFLLRMPSISKAMSASGSSDANKT